MIQTVSIIGASNVATHIAKTLQKHISILNILSRTFDHADTLAQSVNAKPITHIDALEESDLYIIAIPDNAIHTFIHSEWKPKRGILVHTSASTSIEVFKDAKQESYGVLYPLQTFRKHIEMIDTYPFFIEANTRATEEMLCALIQRIDYPYYILSSDKRKYLHLCAVMFNNFFSYLSIEGKKLIKEQGLEYGWFKSILAQTMYSMEHSNTLTGPAIRKDTKTMRTHLDMLEHTEGLKQVYQTISQNIMQDYDIV